MGVGGEGRGVGRRGFAARDRSARAQTGRPYMAQFYDYRGGRTRAIFYREGGYEEHFSGCPPRLPPSALCYVFRTSPLWV